MKPGPHWNKSIDAIKKFHETNKTFTGRRTVHSLPSIRELCKAYAPATLLDYGAGKGVQWSQRDFEFLGEIVPSLAETLNVVPTQYDPGVPGIDVKPVGHGFDAVICVDVLGYVPNDDLSRVVEEIFSFGTKFVYFHVATERPAKECAVDEPWTRSTPIWTNLFDAVGAMYENVDWYARIKEPDGRRALYASHNRQRAYFGYGQFEAAQIEKVRQL